MDILLVLNILILSGFIYCIKLTRDCQVIIKDYKKKSRKYMREVVSK